MAFEMSLACPRSAREGHSGSPFTPSTPRLVVRQKQCSGGPTFAPPSTRSSVVYRWLGHSLRGVHCKRRLVSHRKSPSHKPLRTEGSPPGPEEIRASLQGPDCSCCDGQYNSGLLHQQAGRYEVRLSVCPPLEALILVPSQENCPEGQTHSRSLECDSGQAFQAQSSDPNRVVPISAGVQSFVFRMGPTTSRLVCNPVQSQTSSVCITGTGSDSLGSGRPQSPMGKFGRVHLSTSLPGSPGGGQNDRSGLSADDSHCSRLAKHALVLGPGEFVGSDSLHSSASKGPGDSAVQRTSSQEPQQSKPACVASVASVVIPALAPTLDKSLSDDKSLCPVRALRYYLDRTKDLRKGKDLVFVSFRKGFQKDIVPATISSWIKQTVLLCYQLSDQAAQDLQVRAHDVRAFAASQAFQGGVYWNRPSQPVIGKPTILLPSSI